MRGKPSEIVHTVKAFIRRHGANYTAEEVAQLFGCPYRSVRTWYWEIDCIPRQSEKSTAKAHDLGPAMLLARAPLTSAGKVCRLHRRQRAACDRALRTA